MTRRGPRALTPEEQSLWDRVRDQTNPMHPQRAAPKLQEQVRQPRAVPAPAPIPSFRIGERHTETAIPRPLANEPTSRPVKMDRKSFTNLKRGKLKPEARIDLHGLTLAQAHPALNRFIVDSHAMGRRLVLVITGKGKTERDNGPIPVRRGILRYQVPHWLDTPPLSQVVLQVAEAHLKHGGGGAYYVYLRRHR